jgi:outer membrane protein assembly factor BamB
MRNLFLFGLTLTLFLTALSTLSAQSENKPPIIPITKGESHRMLLGGRGTYRIALIDLQGQLEWLLRVTDDCNDACMTQDGNILYTYTRGAKMITRQGEPVWQYRSSDAPVGGEIHSAQSLPNGNVVVAKSCIPPRILEIDRQGKTAVDIVVNTTITNPHAIFRHVRKTPEGTYLYGLMSETKDGENNKLYEVDSTGKLIRTFPVSLHAFVGIRLPNGNTLVSGGNGHEIIEFDNNAKEVWKITENELPNRPLRYVSGLQRLPNGNTVFVNWQSGGRGVQLLPQITEVTKDKKIVWEYMNFAQLNTLSTVQIIDDNILKAGPALR